MRVPWRTTAAFGTVMALAASGVAAWSAAANPPATAPDHGNVAPATSAVDEGRRNVGYFTQWGIYGRNFTAKSLDTSGAAADLTHLNYAFANIHPDTLTCFEATRPNGPKDSPTEGDYAGDAWADYGKGFTAGESVDGIGDTWDQPLAGSFNQIKELKAEHPQLKAMISIGEWTWSRHFSRAAATPESRETFVESCIDLYIRGNLPVIDGRGGPGSGAGVFDGIDIDWEWPGVPEDKQHPGNYWSEADKENLTALLAEFREQLDALGQETGENYQLSAFLPADETIIEAGWDVSQIFDSLDYGNVQGYDLHGAWEPGLAGHQANLYDDPANPLPADRQFSIDRAIDYYLDHGVPASKLTLGLPLYGRGWTGVTDGGAHGAWQSATGAAPGEFPEEAGTDRYLHLRDLPIFHDEEVMASWAYDGTEFWSFDDPWLVGEKADYIVEKGLSGAMWWDLAGDHENELVGLMADRLAVGTPGGDETGGAEAGTEAGGAEAGTEAGGSEGCSAPAWSASTVYVGGDRVSHAGHDWTARHWTQGDEPAPSEWGPWSDDGACDDTGTDTGTDAGAESGTDAGTEDGGGDPGDPEPVDDQWLTGYWHNFDNGSTVLTVSDVPDAYNLLAVAFADSDPSVPGGIGFTLDSAALNGYTVEQFKADIAARQAAGNKVVISVGGQNGHVSVTNATEAANFAASTHALMQEYGFDGVDIDLEHGIDATFMEQALRQLSASAGPELIITMAPQTIDFQAPSYAYYQLATSITDILTIVNMQYYNSGSMLGCDEQVHAQGTVDFLTAQACLQLEAGLAPSQVGLGLPAVPSAAGGGHQDPGNVTAALDCLATGERCGSYVPEQPWGQIGGAMTWSVNWDATNGYDFATTVGAYLDAH